MLDDRPWPGNAAIDQIGLAGKPRRL